MEKLHDLKSHICSFENLIGAYRDAAKHKRYRDEVLAFTSNLEENLFSIQHDLLHMSYKVGNYREFYVQYPKPRLVMALGFRDRIVQWAIYRQINPHMDKRFITHSYGCRKGKGTLAAAQQLNNWLRLIDRKPNAKDWYIVKGDISKYFYRMDHEKALSIYARMTDDPWFVWLMHIIINNTDVPFGLPRGMNADECPKSQRLYSVGVPIGNLTSQETANAYLDELDQYCKHQLKIHYYLRYMDDFIIVVQGRNNAQRVLDECASFLTGKLLLDISPKSNILPATKGCEFVGCHVSPHGIRVRRKTARHIKRSLRHIAKLYALGEMKIEKCLDIVNSYMGLTKHKNGYNLRRWISENIVFIRNETEQTNG